LTINLLLHYCSFARVKILIKKICVTLVLVLVGSMVNPARAEIISVFGAKFSRTRQIDNRSFKLVGTGVKRFFLMRAFVAGLYLESATPENDVLGDVSRHLEVEYFLNIPAIRLSAFTENYMKKNSTALEWAEIQAEVHEMRRYFVDLVPGDRFSLTYLPESGTTFSHNGRMTGVIPGSVFGRKLFSVWFGNEPFDRGLKKQILGVPILTGSDSLTDLVPAKKEGV
jgi:hypothetical protein